MYNNLVDVVKYFSDEQVCKNHLIKLRWNDKITCPFCSSDKVYIIKTGYKCGNPECYKKFTVLVGTFFENTKIPLSKWFISIYLATSHKKGISSLQLSKDINVTQKTAWFMLHRIREMLKQTAPELLCGIIEADETYIGGKNKNRHKNKRIDNAQGRSVKDKTPVFGLLQRNGKVRSKSVVDTSKKTLQAIINGAVKSKSKIITDEWLSYQGLKKNYKHKIINHGQGEYVNGEFHTNSLEGFWSLFKRGIIGIYHSVSQKHLDKYCQEFEFRYNTRDLNEQTRFDQSISQCNGRLKYKTLISET